jgi:hypothetical protein
MNNNKEPTRKRIQYHTGYIFSMTMVFWLIITAFTGGLGVFLLPVFLIAFVYLAWKDKVDTDWSNNRINEDEGGHDYKGGIGYLSESKYKLGRIDPDDIKTYPTNEIPKSGRFTPKNDARNTAGEANPLQELLTASITTCTWRTALLIMTIIGIGTRMRRENPQ